MRVAISQINFHIGNFRKNLSAMLNAVQEAVSQKADLIVFSELSVCGYPPQDLLEHKEFIDSCMHSVEELARHSEDIAIIVGSPSVNPNEKGKKLYNSAFFLSGGRISGHAHKTLLPTYDIFDEYRYFEPNTEFRLIEHCGKKIALTICEDLWDNQPVENSFAQTRLYRNSPMEALAALHPDLIVNISASPFASNKLQARRIVMSENAKRYELPIIYCNQVGANTELIFDGGSMIISSQGEVHEPFAPFAEGVFVYDLDHLSEQKNFDLEPAERDLSDEYRLEMIFQALVFGLKDYFRKTGFTKATLGLSGGIDSALTLVIAAEALGADNIHVLLLPSKFSSDHSLTDSISLARNLGIPFTQIDIQPAVDQVNRQLEPLFEGTTSGLAEENIQARIRGILLMALSNKHGHILLNTSNKSETAVGYSTLYGDMSGGLSVIGDLYKTDVYRLSRYVNREKEIIPYNILEKEPSAELRPDQRDSDSLPDYHILDKILLSYIEHRMSLEDIVEQGFESQLVENVIRMVNRSEYKRFQAPPILRISSKAFGMGRRIPLVAAYSL